MRPRLTAIAIVLLAVAVIAVTIVTDTATFAQSATLPCGGITKGNFRQASQTDSYSLALKEGDKMFVNVKASGDTLTLGLTVRDPIGRDYFAQGLGKEWTYESPTLAGEGTYTILVWNTLYGRQGGLGSYTLSVGCTLADGTVIRAGSGGASAPAPQPTARPGATAAPTVAPASAAAQPTPAFSGVGFPGLPPKDFSAAFEVPLQVTVPFTGSVSPGAADTLTLPFDGKAGDVLTLDFARVSGNLNLGVVLLNDKNQILFHSTIVASDLVSTRLRLPTAGRYTVGVFRIDLVTPQKPEKTTFRIQAKVTAGR